MKRCIEFIKKQSVLCIAFLCAAATMIAVPPDSQYAGYINVTTLILLFCLMGAVSGFESCGIFRKMSDVLTVKCKSLRALVFVMMNVCFFSSMFITNDVALITFVPVTVMVFERINPEKRTLLIWAIIIETAAANLGSMLLPTGNPQNIFLCSEYSLSPVVLIKTLLPYAAASYLILSLSILLIPSQKITAHREDTLAKSASFSVRTAVLCTGTFVISLLTVSGIMNEYICLGASIALLTAADWKIFSRIDYSLLFTFVFFFVFTGNIGRIDAMQSFLAEAVQGRELAAAVISSQVISNVPAAVLLSTFTDKASLLLIGTNIGGLGTPIASLASLISYRIYASGKETAGGVYMVMFLAFNMIFLASLSLLALLLN